MAVYRQPHMGCWHQLDPKTGSARCNINVKLNTDNVLCIEAKDVATQQQVRKVCPNCFKRPSNPAKFAAAMAGRQRYYSTMIPRTSCPKCPSGKLTYNQESKTYRCPDCLRRFVRNAQDDLVVRSGKLE